MSPRRIRARTFLALAVILSACNGVVPPEQTHSPTLPEPTISKSPQVAETMVVGVHLPVDQALGGSSDFPSIDLPLYTLHPNGNLWDDVVTRFVYSGVYRLDETQSPVPDLAAEPCAVSADLMVVTCRLREASFHDGTPLTAEDVAFTYRIGLSEACRGILCVNGDEGKLAEATALDARTVEFRLTGPWPAFITSVMPTVLIEPRARVEGAFAEFVEDSRGGDPKKLRSASDSLNVTLHPSGDESCKAPVESVLATAEKAIAGIRRQLRSRDAYAPGGDCAYGDYLVRVLTDAADAMRLTGIDAIAAAYRILEPPQLPVGSGPWRVVSIDPGVRMQLEAFPTFHRGAPATARLDVRLYHTTADATEAIRSGAVDWLLQPFETGENLVNNGIGDAAGVAWEEFNRLSFTGLHYNLRKGRLFEDPNLREAIELCVDKEETVAAATGGTGVPIYSPIVPSMWAFEADLPRPKRDIVKSHALIKASGWTLGADGIYHKGDQRLRTMVPVWKDRPALVRFVELLAFQVADCGIEIVPNPISLDDLGVALNWPQVPPGADQPWDAVFSGWITSYDPDFLPLFHSSVISTKSEPRGNNYMGYDSAECDTLLEEGRATYDQRERARVYRDFQRVLANDRPVLFAWSPRIRAPRSARLASTRGPLATGTSTWWWELETLVIRSPEP